MKLIAITRNQRFGADRKHIVDVFSIWPGHSFTVNANKQTVARRP